MKLTDYYDNIAKYAAHYSGHPITFILAIGSIVLWAITGPMFHYSDTWQLVVNTGSSLITFLMVFLIQNTQNRTTLALQVKLDELILTSENAKNILLDLEELDEESLEEFKKKYLLLAQQARQSQEKSASTAGRN